MKTMHILALAVALTFFGVAPSVGMPVTDSGAYAYFVEQLKKDVKQIENQLKNIEAIQNVHKGVTETYSQLKGVYDNITSAIAFAKKVEQAAKDLPSTGQRYLEGKKNEIIDAYTDPETQELDVRKLLDDKYKDERNPDISVWNEAAGRHNMRQSALRNAIETSESALSTIKDQLQILEETMNDVNEESTNPNVKSAQDFTNNLLAQQNAILIEIKQVLAAYTSAEAQAKHAGYDKETGEKLEKGPKKSETATFINEEADKIPEAKWLDTI